MKTQNTPGPKPTSIQLSEYQRQHLNAIVNSRNSKQGTVQRAKIILMASEGATNARISREFGIHDDTVRTWRGRWAESQKRLDKIESEAFSPVQDQQRGAALEIQENKSALQQLESAIGEILNDKPRSGAPLNFTAEQFAAIIALSCESPCKCGREVTHWTPRELKDEVLKRKIVEKISVSTVGRLLRDSVIKPHLMRYWEYNERDKDPQAFDEKIHEIGSLYLSAAELYEQGTVLVSTDEKTSMQALAPTGPTMPCKPGQVERREFEYKRNGTQVLTANFEVATGAVISPTIEHTRTEEQFAAHIERTINTNIDLKWIFIVDQLNTHKSETLVRSIAKICGVEDDLGKKGKCGILKSMDTRKSFLEDYSHKVRFVYLPKHTSWMNQVEMWFSILSKRFLKRGVFNSTAELREKLLRFIEYFNETMAKPFKWTYTGKPLSG